MTENNDSHLGVDIGNGKTRIMITLIVLIIAIQVLQGCTQPYFDEVAWRQSVEQTPVKKLYAKHIQEDRYFNPWHNSVEKLEDLLNWLFAGSGEYTDREREFLPEVRKNPLPKIQANQDRDYIVWIGHNSFLIKTGKAVWLTDPMFSERAMIQKRRMPPAVTATDITAAFTAINVVISHNHYDHMDEESIKSLSVDYLYFVPKGLKSQIEEWLPGATVKRDGLVAYRPNQHRHRIALSAGNS